MPFVKKIYFVVGVVMIAIFAIIMSLTTYLQTESSIKLRNIDTDQIGTLSYGDQIDKMLAQFDCYSYDINENNIKFSASTIKDLSDFDGYQLLNTLDDSKLTKNYSSNFNCETQEFVLITDYIQNGLVLKTIKDVVEPYYDESKNDYFIDLEDGTRLSVSETLQLDNLNQCVALVDDLAVVAIAVLAITIVVAAPEIEKICEKIVTTVVTWVRSFISWFRSLFKPKTKTVTTTTITTVITYPVTIANTTYKLKEYTSDRLFDKQLYYVALADTDDGKMYVSTIPIPEVAALSVLTQEIYVKSAHKNSKKEFVLSIYTLNQQIADNLATKAGGLIGSPGRIFHKATKVGYFNHFHPGAVYHEPHCFFGYPRVA